MPAAAPKRQPEPSPHHPTPHIYTLEATGVIVIALMILALAVIRYWHHIPWNWR